MSSLKHKRKAKNASQGSNSLSLLAEAQKRTEQRVEELTITMEKGFKELRDQITSLGSRWGLETEAVFRNTVTGLLGKKPAIL